MAGPLTRRADPQEWGQMSVPDDLDDSGPRHTLAAVHDGDMGPSPTGVVGVALASIVRARLEPANRDRRAIAPASCPRRSGSRRVGPRRR